jgi:hypothetical protein
MPSDLTCLAPRWHDPKRSISSHLKSISSYSLQSCNNYFVSTFFQLDLFVVEVGVIFV